jgi:glucose/arabinose dehydrogenase
MAFLGPNDILVLEKNQGTVKRIVNGTILSQPLLKVNVDTENERGMLGITVAKNITYNTVYVFVYYTQSKRHNAEDVTEGKDPLCACLYRYELVDNKLVNPKLLLSLPSIPGSDNTPDHLGGKVLIGPDKDLYLVIGDVGGRITTAVNINRVQTADGTAGILRITQDGKAVQGGIIGNKFPLDLYYAYGIRNSFGMDFDPVTKMLWDTENGPSFGDEINLVEPGFNSGWMQVQGIWKPTGPSNFLPGNITLHPNNLLDFGGKGKYRAPEFSWYGDVGPTAVKFLNSDKLGKQYKNDMFVGDFHYGNLYHFKLGGNRTSLILNGSLSDKVARNNSVLQPITFGQGFGGITDMQVGPDGYLYILSLYAGGDDCNPILPNAPCFSYSSSMQGSIFRIVPINKQ